VDEIKEMIEYKHKILHGDGWSNQIYWKILDPNRTDVIKRDFDQYKFRINDVVFKSYTKKFIKALKEEQIWQALKND